MRTGMTELCGIKYPIMNAGMSYIAVPEMVAAVSNAGGLGFLATAPLTPDRTREAIKKIRELTDKPFGANVTLLYEFAAENAKVLLEEKVPVINWSLGRAKWIIEAAHEYGGKVLGTVTIARHAIAAERDGADGLIVTGHEAAAHGGEVTSLVLIPVISRKLKVPVIAAGGFADGRGLAAALVLGAEGVSIGTGFSLTKESPAHERIKELLLKATELDTFYSEKVDGMGSRFWKTELALSMAKGTLSPIRSYRSVVRIKEMLELSWPQILMAGFRSGDFFQRLRQAQAVAAVEKSVLEEDESKMVVPIGQIIGLIDKELTCQEFIERMVAECEEVTETTRAKIVT